MCLQCDCNNVLAMTKFSFQTLVHVCFVLTGAFPLPQQGHRCSQKKVITAKISIVKFSSELFSILPSKN